MTGDERIVEANGVPLCLRTHGDPGDSAILLVHGACASLLWWDDGLCDRLSAGGRFVIRYDQRDTGRSISYPPGRPGYSLADLADDSIGVLDALGIERAHLVGRSMGGGVVMIAGVDRPDRVASLTLLGSTTDDTDLPPMSAEFLAATAEPPPDPTDRSAVVSYIVDLMRAYAGGSAYFAEAPVRELAELDVDRTANMGAALINPFRIELAGPRSGGGFADVRAPSLVVHGELDPVFPLPHGLALQAAIPGAELLVLAGTGHDLPAERRDEFIEALLRHTEPPTAGPR